MSTQPTDAELKALWQIHAADIGGIFSYALAVLAKWGQPAQAAEPFCWHWENTFNGGTGTVKKNPETLGINMSHPDYKWTALYTAPQPMEREPLTEAQREKIIEAVDWYNFPRDVIDAVERAHDIKGGQHGTESST